MKSAVNAVMKKMLKAPTVLKIVVLNWSLRHDKAVQGHDQQAVPGVKWLNNELRSVCQAISPRIDRALKVSASGGPAADC